MTASITIISAVFTYFIMFWITLTYHEYECNIEYVWWLWIMRLWIWKRIINASISSGNQCSRGVGYYTQLVWQVKDCPSKYKYKGCTNKHKFLYKDCSSKYKYKHKDCPSKYKHKHMTCTNKHKYKGCPNKYQHVDWHIIYKDCTRIQIQIQGLF